MCYRYIIPILACLVLSCKKERTANNPASPPPVIVTPPPAPPPSLLKDMIISNLPSPYYHFDYNTANRPTFVSFSSGLGMYEILYNNDRISEMKNTVIVNKDRLVYSYNAIGKADTVRYVDSSGVLYKRCHFAYNGQLLTKVTWERKAGRVFIADRNLSLTYYGDGNVQEITDHRLAVPGQTEQIFIKHFSQYDNKVNSDGFMLVHDANNDHLILLPGVQLQKNNASKVRQTGTGVHYEAVYTYTYNGKNAPLAKQGTVTFLNGASAGQQFQTNTSMTYY